MNNFLKNLIYFYISYSLLIQIKKFIILKVHSFWFTEKLVENELKISDFELNLIQIEKKMKDNFKNKEIFDQMNNVRDFIEKFAIIFNN